MRLDHRPIARATFVAAAMSMVLAACAGRDATTGEGASRTPAVTTEPTGQVDPIAPFTGDGSVSYWNNYVAVTQMGGSGDFSDPRIKLNISQRPDLVTPKLRALLEYQLSLPKPPAPAGSFDADKAKLGQAVFNGAARCGSCHIAPTYTDVQNGANGQPLLHLAETVGANPAYAMRSATFAVSKEARYRTTPLRGLWQHAPYFHDGHAATLADVVDHYIGVFKLTLSAQDRENLIEFLKSL